MLSLKNKSQSLSYRMVSGIIAFAFIVNLVIPPNVSYAQLVPQSVLNLPVPGTMLTRSSQFTPALIKGMTVYPNNPLEFDFIISRGDDNLDGMKLREESRKMIKYFLAALTVPEKDLWVNLSPYEKDRIIPEGFGQTEMGRDLLAQDYLLKQLTSSMMYPEKELGKAFWDRVYKKAQSQFGTTDIPMETLHKVWIVPSHAKVFVNNYSAFVVDSHLKVMLEKDYLAMANYEASSEDKSKQTDQSSMVDFQSSLIREILIPEIEREVNEGTTFANLRQIYNSMILAVWYKQNLKESLLGQVYMDQNKLAGVDVEDKQIKLKIYNQYLQAFKKGAYDYIKEDYDPITQQIIPRKYFSGGTAMGPVETVGIIGVAGNQTQLSVREAKALPDAAMVSSVGVKLVEVGSDNANETVLATLQADQAQVSSAIDNVSIAILSDSDLVQLPISLFELYDQVEALGHFVVDGENESGTDSPIFTLGVNPQTGDKKETKNPTAAFLMWVVRHSKVTSIRSEARNILAKEMSIALQVDTLPDGKARTKAFVLFYDFYGFNVRAANALLNANITSLPQLTALTKEELIKIHEIGPGTADHIEAQLAKKGERLAEQVNFDDSSNRDVFSDDVQASLSEIMLPWEVEDILYDSSSGNITLAKAKPKGSDPKALEKRIVLTTRELSPLEQDVIDRLYPRFFKLRLEMLKEILDELEIKTSVDLAIDPESYRREGSIRVIAGADSERYRIYGLPVQDESNSIKIIGESLFPSETTKVSQARQDVIFEALLSLQLSLAGLSQSEVNQVEEKLRERKLLSPKSELGHFIQESVEQTDQAQLVTIDKLSDFDLVKLPASLLELYDQVEGLGHFYIESETPSATNGPIVILGVNPETGEQRDTINYTAAYLMWVARHSRNNNLSLEARNILSTQMNIAFLGEAEQPDGKPRTKAQILFYDFYEFDQNTTKALIRENITSLPQLIALTRVQLEEKYSIPAASLNDIETRLTARGQKLSKQAESPTKQEDLVDRSNSEIMLPWETEDILYDASTGNITLVNAKPIGADSEVLGKNIVLETREISYSERENYLGRLYSRFFRLRRGVLNEILDELEIMTPVDLTTDPDAYWQKGSIRVITRADSERYGVYGIPIKSENDSIKFISKSLFPPDTTRFLPATQDVMFEALLFLHLSLAGLSQNEIDQVEQKLRKRRGKILQKNKRSLRAFIQESVEQVDQAQVVASDSAVVSERNRGLIAQYLRIHRGEIIKPESIARELTDFGIIKDGKAPLLPEIDAALEDLLGANNIRNNKGWQVPLNYIQPLVASSFLVNAESLAMVPVRETSFALKVFKNAFEQNGKRQTVTLIRLVDQNQVRLFEPFAPITEPLNGSSEEIAREVTKLLSLSDEEFASAQFDKELGSTVRKFRKQLQKADQAQLASGGQLLLPLEAENITYDANTGQITLESVEVGELNKKQDIVLETREPYNLEINAFGDLYDKKFETLEKNLKDILRNLLLDHVDISDLFDENVRIIVSTDVQKKHHIYGVSVDDADYPIRAVSEDLFKHVPTKHNIELAVFEALIYLRLKMAGLNDWQISQIKNRLIKAGVLSFKVRLDTFLKNAIANNAAVRDQAELSEEVLEGIEGADVPAVEKAASIVLQKGTDFKIRKGAISPDGIIAFFGELPTEPLSWQIRLVHPDVSNMVRLEKVPSFQGNIDQLNLAFTNEGNAITWDDRPIPTSPDAPTGKNSPEPDKVLGIGYWTDNVMREVMRLEEARQNQIESGIDSASSESGERSKSADQAQLADIYSDHNYFLLRNIHDFITKDGAYNLEGDLPSYLDFQLSSMLPGSQVVFGVDLRRNDQAPDDLEGFLKNAPYEMVSVTIERGQDEFIVSVDRTLLDEDQKTIVGRQAEATFLDVRANNQPPMPERTKVTNVVNGIIGRISINGRYAWRNITSVQSGVPEHLHRQLLDMNNGEQIVFDASVIRVDQTIDDPNEVIETVHIAIEKFKNDFIVTIRRTLPEDFKGATQADEVILFTAYGDQVRLSKDANGNKVVTLSGEEFTIFPERSTMLILDDDLAERGWRRAHVQNFGYNFLVGEDANSMIAILEFLHAQEVNVDLILSDRRMPGITGLEFGKQIKSSEVLPEIPLIIITGSPHKAQEAIEDPNSVVVAALGKPVLGSILEKAILEHLPNARSVKPERTIPPVEAEKVLENLKVAISDSKINDSQQVIVTPDASFSIDPNRKTVLIVDDEAVQREARQLLLMKKFNVVLVEDGEDAVTVLQENPGVVDLVLSDHDMPILNGLELAREVQAKNLGPSVVLITGNDTIAEGIQEAIDDPNSALVGTRDKLAISKRQGLIDAVNSYLPQDDTDQAQLAAGKVYETPQAFAQAMGFGINATNMVIALGIRSIDELSKLKENQLRQYKGFKRRTSQVALNQVKNKLAEYKRSLAKDFDDREGLIIDHLELTGLILTALHNEGIETIDQLMDLTEGEVVAILQRFPSVKREVSTIKDEVRRARSLDEQHPVFKEGTTKTDSAVLGSDGTPVGGINLDPALLDLEIKRDENFVPLPMDQQPINLKIDGFVPVIINVTPVNNLPLLLGFDPTLIDDESEPRQEARFEDDVDFFINNRFPKSITSSRRM